MRSYILYERTQGSSSLNCAFTSFSGTHPLPGNRTATTHLPPLPNYFSCYPKTEQQKQIMQTNPTRCCLVDHYPQSVSQLRKVITKGEENPWVEDQPPTTVSSCRTEGCCWIQMAAVFKGMTMRCVSIIDRVWRPTPCAIQFGITPKPPGCLAFKTNKKYNMRL